MNTQNQMNLRSYWEFNETSAQILGLWQNSNTHDKLHTT